ncbi:MAG TPA: DUF6036 family nucleotidyltransferase [Acidimicrobiales bacterium]|nr:DUF6036 family nucleotidyltransferase [Acidimicrobiales bacterium]
MLTREDALNALDELVAELQMLEQRSRIYIVGGAALMLGFGARDATHDIDAVITPRTEIMLVVLDIARRRNLPDDWLNSAAAMYVPAWPDDPSPRIIISTERVEVSIASADMLLAMKIHASRGRQDVEDLRFLLTEVGIDNYDDAVSHYERFYENDPIKSRAIKILTDIFSGPASNS